jgi:outer membrane protein OmpA-like peptidoglycan-associated protein/HAMP domain-containing protein
MIRNRGLRVLALSLLAALLALGLWGTALRARALQEREEARQQVTKALAEGTRPERAEELFRRARAFNGSYAACEEGDRLRDRGRFAEAADSFQACLKADPDLIAVHQAWAEALLRARGEAVYEEVRGALLQLLEDQRATNPKALAPIRELLADLDDLSAEDSPAWFPREWSEAEILELLTREIRGSSRYDGRRVPLSLGFRPGDVHLGRPAEQQLRHVANALKNGLLIQANIQIEGYADGIEADSKAERKELALRRAEAVKRFLVRCGVPEKRLYVKALGEVHPIASNQTEDGRTSNRRVELFNLETKQPIYKDVRKPD